MIYYAYIDDDGVVWSITCSPKTVEEIIAITGFPITARLTDVPELLQAKGSGLMTYHIYVSGDAHDMDDYELGWNLDMYKAQKIETIDAKTDELIVEGQPFDDEVFDSTETAQFNWKNMFDLVMQDLMPLPVDTCTIDDKPYTFTTKEQVANFYFSGVQRIQMQLASGRQLKYAVKACTTKAEVDAIVDPR